MSIEALGNIGDFLGGVAVLITLIYLAIQIRGNTKATQSDNRARVAMDYMEVLEPENDPELSRIFVNGLRNYPDLPAEDLARFGWYINRHSLFFQAVYARFEKGQLEKETYNAYLNWYCCLVATPGGSKWFNDTARPTYVPAVVKAVDGRIEEGGLLDATSLPVYRALPNDT